MDYKKKQGEVFLKLLPAIIRDVDLGSSLPSPGLNSLWSTQAVHFPF